MAGTPLNRFAELLSGGGRIVLASTSARRHQILSQINLTFDVVESGFPEDLDKKSFPQPADYAVENAKLKCLGAFKQLGLQAATSNHAAKSIPDQKNTPLLVIACDTIVVANNGCIFEKPVDAVHAKSMLSQLNNAWHDVISGVWLALRNSEPNNCSPINCLRLKNDCSGIIYEYCQVGFFEQTRVRFSNLPDDVLDGYIASGEGYGKAGGYAIQGLGASLVERIEGDYYNVMGFPLNRFCRELSVLLEQCKY